MMTLEEFVEIVKKRNEVQDMVKFDEMEEMAPFRTIYFRSFIPHNHPVRSSKYFAAVTAIPDDCYNFVAQRGYIRYGGIRSCAIVATWAWPKEASMILSLPLDAVRVLLDAGNHCAPLIYPYMRLIHDDA